MAQPIPGMLKVRMGLHTGEAGLSDGDYASAPLNRCARLMAVAHGGQVLMSEAIEALVPGALPDGVTVVDLGEHRLRDLPAGCTCSRSSIRTCRARFPALRSLDALPGNLPLQVSSFVGRAREIERTRPRWARRGWSP